MSDIEKKRDFVTGLYPGPRWRERVRKMPDAQVIAIYLHEYGKAKKADKAKESSSDPAPF